MVTGRIISIRKNEVTTKVVGKPKESVSSKKLRVSKLLPPKKPKIKSFSFKKEKADFLEDDFFDDDDLRLSVNNLLR